MPEFAPRPKLVAMTVRIPEPLSKALERIATNERVRRSDVIVKLLEHGVEEYEARK